ncbi:MAG TPA: hydrolase 1, exosortase A system-associated [Paracoccaceae bacterium]|nr:hydrolase 1, exosortase A system-associated [Paracoccaceae bacterium]
MTRRHFTFPCAGETLVATLDEAPGKVGLLMITGGNETRAGAFCGQALLAARIAAAGHPVLRFDRRGVGDSSGNNAGFTGSANDIAAALSALRTQCPQLGRIVGYGNCDAASSLMLAQGAGLGALALANPWTFDAADEAPPPEAVRRRYVEKLKNPRELLRLVSGGVSFRKLAGGVVRALSPSPPPSTLLGDMQAGLANFAGPVRYLLAERDRTAQAFMVAYPQSMGHWQVCPDGDHAFSSDQASEWLFNVLLDILHKQARQLDMG